MAINLKKLQAVARRRLELKGTVRWSAVPKSQLSVFGGEYLGTVSNGLVHTISYSNANALDTAAAFHELCKAKLNELGFSMMEAAALNAMRECSKDDPQYIKDATSAATIVLETYVNSLLFSVFPEESRAQRDRMLLRFESSDALTSLHTQMGFWGTAGLSYHKMACNNSGIPFPQDLIEKAIGRASDGQEIRKEYDVTNSLLQELPKMDFLKADHILPEESVRIVDVMLRLFSAKTGLECE